MHIVRGLGAAPVAPMVNPFTIPDDTIDTWKETAPGRTGHNSTYNCYCWGYRPAYTPVVIMGLSGLGGQRWRNVLPSWNICPFDCPDAPCPPQAAPPPRLPCPPPPPPAPCPTCPPAAMVAPEPEPEKFGINVGLVIAATMAAGVGYYAWKRRKKR